MSTQERPELELRSTILSQHDDDDVGGGRDDGGGGRDDGGQENGTQFHTPT